MQLSDSKLYLPSVDDSSGPVRIILDDLLLEVAECFGNTCIRGEEFTRGIRRCAICAASLNPRG